VDAYTGEILDKEDLILFANGQGLVFDPNPVVTANNNTFRDPDATAQNCGFGGTQRQTIDAERVAGTLRDITLSGGNHKLEGPYVKLKNFAAPDIAPPEEANANDFTYSSGDDDFEAVMAYHHVDTIQRYIQSLGITTAHNKQIEADAHDNTYNAAWFSPIDGGLHFSDSGSCRPDRAEDADCIAHEYGHAILNNQVTNWGEKNTTTNRYETKAMGEGFGDILATVLFAPSHAYQREVFEDWIFADQGGLRRVDGTKVYPTDWAYNVHQDGEIWSAALWNIYRAIGGDSVNLAEREAARDELLETVIESHHHVPFDGTMPDGAEQSMIEEEEIPEYRGKHLIEFLDSFHDRGILECVAGSDLKIKKLWTQNDNSSTRSHEDPEYGQDNWFYAEIKNEGTAEARAFVVTFSISFPFSSPVYPSSFRDDIISAWAKFDLAPGATMTASALWPKELIPHVDAHGCVFCEVYNPVDHVPAGATHIWEGNGKIKYRNTDVVDAIPNDTLDYFFDIGNFRLAKEELVRLEVVRPQKWEHVEVGLHHHNTGLIRELWRKMEVIKAEAAKPIEEVIGRRREVRILEPARIAIEPRVDEPYLIFDLARGSSILIPERPAEEAEVRAGIDEEFVRRDADLIELEDRAYLKLRPGRRVGFPYTMRPRDRTRLNIKIRTPEDAKPGDQFTIEVVQRNTKGELIGGFDVQVNIIER